MVVGVAGGGALGVLPLFGAGTRRGWRQRRDECTTAATMTRVNQPHHARDGSARRRQGWRRPLRKNVGVSDAPHWRRRRRLLSRPSCGWGVEEGGDARSLGCARRVPRLQCQRWAGSGRARPRAPTPRDGGGRAGPVGPVVRGGPCVGYVGCLLGAWSAPQGQWPWREVAQRYADAMALPFVAHSAAEYYRWVVRSQWRLDGRRFARCVDSVITVPVLQLHGDQDRAVIPALAPRSSAYVQGPFEQHVITGAGHFLPEEAPAAVNAHLVRWLNSRR